MRIDGQQGPAGLERIQERQRDTKHCALHKLIVKLVAL